MFTKSPRNPDRSSSGTIAKYHVKSRHQQQRKERDIDERNRWLNSVHQMNNSEICMQDFLDTTERKNLYAEALRLVNLAAEREMAEELENRRRKRLVEEEEMMIARKQEKENQMETRLKERQERIRLANEEKERERERFVEQKKMQQFLNDCDDIRPHMQQRLLRDTKASQLLQIADKEKIKQAQQDQDRMWWEVIRRSNNEQLERETLEQKLRTERRMCMIQTLNAQVEEKQKRSLDKSDCIEERRKNKLAVEELCESERKRALEANEKKRAYKEELQKQREHNRMIKEQDRMLQLQNGRNYANKIQAELEEERLKMVNAKKQFRGELDEYMNYVRHSKHDRTISEVEKERLIIEYARKIDEETYERVQNLRRQKSQMEKESYGDMLRQINENHDRNVREFELKRKEISLVRDDIQRNTLAEKQAEFERRQNAHRYSEELQQQTELVKNMKKLELENERKYLKQLEANENVYKNKVQAMLNMNSNINEMIHPNRKLVEQEEILNAKD